MMKYLAAREVYPIPPGSGSEIDFGTFSGFGKLGNPEGTGIETFSKLISSIVGLLTIIGIIWFVFVFVTGAISMITAGGDKAQLESARKRITTGLIGLVVVIAALFIVDLIGSLIGIPNILDLPALFEKIQL
jgi:hypothetical protein